MLETFNEFYKNYFQFQSKSKIIRINENKIYLEKTVFYAESGGQESDTGTIKFNDMEFDVNNVQYEEKDTSLWKTAHYIVSDKNINDLLKVGDEVDLLINQERRKKLSAYHTASHLLFIAAEQVRHGIQKNVIGCHIKEDSARFDFRTDEKFNEEEIQLIEKYVNELISNKLDVKTYYIEQDSPERVWECDGIKIPCGGTHLDNTSHLNFLKVKRKGIGKEKERLICITEHNSIIHGGNYA